MAQHLPEFTQALLKYFPKDYKILLIAQIVCMNKDVTIKAFLICIISSFYKFSLSILDWHWRMYFKYEFPLRRIKSAGYILSFSDWKLLASGTIFGESNSTFFLCWQNKNRQLTALLKIICQLRAIFSTIYRQCRIYRSCFSTCSQNPMQLCTFKYMMRHVL